MERKKRMLLCGIIILLMALVTIYIMIRKKSLKENIDNGYFEIIDENPMGGIVWAGVAEDGISTCIVGNENIIYPDIVPGKYIIYYPMKSFSEQVWGEMYLGRNCTYERYEICVYDLRTGEDRELFDLVEFMEAYPEWQVTGRLGCYEINGRDVVEIRLGPRPKEGVSYFDAEEPEYLIIDIEDGSWEIQSEELWLIWGDGIFAAWGQGGRNLLEQNLPEGLFKALEYKNIDKYFNYYGVYEFYEIAEYLPEHNEELYGLFPELERYRGQEDCYIHIWVGNNLTLEQLLRLRMEDGQEIVFEEFVIPGCYTIDGEDHEVHSLEECEQWIR